jgi:transcriptional regulator GlxA family with amidase domain
LIGNEAAQRIPVYVVLPPRALLLDIAGPLEVLRMANRLQKGLRFDIRYIGPSRSVASSIGLTLAEIQPLPRLLSDHAMVMLGGTVDPGTQLGAQREINDDNTDETAIVAWLRGAIRPGHRLISICSGALLAGRAGLLDGYSCTTHHDCCTELAALVPKARVLENRLYVVDGERYSSAGVTAGVDLMLHIVSELIDHACAAAIARYLVVYLRRSGADPQLSPWLEGRNHIHPAIHRVQDALAADPTKQWTLRRLARVAGASSRHLSRLFHEHAGMSITDYRNRLRVALARELLSQTRLDMEHIAERSGFGSTRQLRRAWGRQYPTSPREARRLGV